MAYCLKCDSVFCKCNEIEFKSMLPDPVPFRFMYEPESPSPLIPVPSWDGMSIPKPKYVSVDRVTETFAQELHRTTSMNTIHQDIGGQNFWIGPPPLKMF